MPKKRKSFFSIKKQKEEEKPIWQTEGRQLNTKPVNNNVHVLDCANAGSRKRKNSTNKRTIHSSLFKNESVFESDVSSESSFGIKRKVPDAPLISRRKLFRD